MRRSLRILAVAAAAFCTMPSLAWADPSVWARARDPAMSARADAVARVDALVRRAARGELGDRVAADRAGDYLREARKVLEEWGAETSSALVLRHRYGEVLFRLGEVEHAVVVLESIRTAAPPPVRREITHTIAIAYSRLGRHSDEVDAYTDELELEPHSRRGVLLANRAEAYMALGDLTSAIDGYRHALASLTQLEMFDYGVTTLWGFAVASDRAGDLAGAFNAVQLARRYDPFDRRISDSTAWSWNPPHEELWYRALGNWATARATDQAAVRAEALSRSAALFGRYMSAAPPDDPWLALAKLRRAQVEKERVDARAAVAGAVTPRRLPERPAASKPRAP